MGEDANTLGLNCYKLKCNWATVQQRETWGVKVQFSKIVSCKTMQSYVNIVCNKNIYLVKFSAIPNNAAPAINLNQFLIKNFSTQTLKI